MVAALDKSQVLAMLAEVHDPEIPVLSLADLGVIHDIEIADGRVTVVLKPTYSGCPAMHAMRADVLQALREHGVSDGHVQLVNSPAWSSDDISEAGRQKLFEYGIAPPEKNRGEIRCPQCQSRQVECISEFGSTACKALYRCTDCLEPFDYFKCL